MKVDGRLSPARYHESYPEDEELLMNLQCHATAHMQQDVLLRLRTILCKVAGHGYNAFP